MWGYNAEGESTANAAAKEKIKPLRTTPNFLIVLRAPDAINRREQAKSKRAVEEGEKAKVAEAKRKRMTKRDAEAAKKKEEEEKK